MKKTTILMSLFLASSLIMGNTLFAQGKKPPVTEQKKESTAPISQQTQTNQASVSVSSPSSQQTALIPLKKITLEEAKKIFDEGKAVFIDGRSRSAYEIRHIQGALNCSMGEFPVQIEEIKKKVPLNTQIVTYCSGETCGLAEKVGRKMMEQGYTDILVFQPGWPAWAQAGFPAQP